MMTCCYIVYTLIDFFYVLLLTLLTLIVLCCTEEEFRGVGMLHKAFAVEENGCGACCWFLGVLAKNMPADANVGDGGNMNPYCGDAKAAWRPPTVLLPLAEWWWLFGSYAAKSNEVKENALEEPSGVGKLMRCCEAGESGGGRNIGGKSVGGKGGAGAATKFMRLLPSACAAALLAAASAIINSSLARKLNKQATFSLREPSSLSKCCC